MFLKITGGEGGGGASAPLQLQFNLQLPIGSNEVYSEEAIVQTRSYSYIQL
jgi:hypothetical protein